MVADREDQQRKPAPRGDGEDVDDRRERVRGSGIHVLRHLCACGFGQHAALRLEV